MKLRQKIRPIVAVLIVLAWITVELMYGIKHPTLELRVMLFSSLVYLFGESVTDAIDIVRGNSKEGIEAAE